MESQDEQDLVTTETASDERQPIMSAADAMAALKEGRELKNVKIIGLTFHASFNKPIKLIHVTLVHPVFSKCQFSENVSIFDSVLVKPRFDKKAVFEKGLNFSGSTLKNANFRNVTIKDAMRLENAEVVGLLRFQSVQFEGSIRVWGTHFCGWTEFRDCDFAGQADFRSFTSDEGFSMDRCHCHDDALFRGASITKKFSLDTSTFEAAVDLSKAKLHDFTYLERIEQGEKQYFAFANAVADRILVKTTQLEGRLQSEESGDFATAMQEYGLLKRCYSSLHRYDDEDWAFYQFKVCQRKAKSRSWLRPWSKLTEWGDRLFLDWGCGYGTNPFRAIGAAVVIMLVFTVIFAIGYERFMVKTPPVPQLEAGHVINRVVYSGMTSVSVFTAGFTGDHLVSARGWVLVPLAIEALMGTLLWGLFIVAFSRKVIR